MRKIQEADTSSLKKLFRYMRQYRILLFFSCGLATVSSILMLYVPILFGKAIDNTIHAGQLQLSILLQTLRNIVIIILITSLSTWFMNLINNKLSYQIVRDLRCDSMNKVQHLPLQYLDTHSIGDMESRIIADCDQIGDSLLVGFSQLFSGVVTIIATLIFMISKSWLISLIVILLTPISFFVAKFIASHSFHLFKEQSSIRGEQTGLIEEMIGEEKTVQAFGYQEKAKLRFKHIDQKLQKTTEKAIFFSSLVNPSTRFVNGVIYALVALVGSFSILSAQLTVGGLSVLLGYANQYMKPFNDISSVITELQNALACASRIFEIMEQQAESADATGTLGISKGHVNVQDVSFSYRPDKPFIKNFNVEAKPGMRIAIVGPTGCGKTTFINLLMRFYDIQAGSIQIDGQDIHSISRHELRKNFGMVLQDTWIQNGTIRENILLGKPEASEEEILQAAKESHSYDFIMRLAKGFDTEVDESGMSQGEKQLLCMTRVMLCLPPMLILDEATSSIDTRTEIQIQQAFDNLMKGRTSFVVAHRLSTIRHADMILVMKDGHIIEQGNHDSLLAKHGFYHHLYTGQFELPQA
ncbi:MULTISPECIES: ABC transporter ATP-binding protein [Terrabacteria group]|uniref:ABC transporter ATP-binding protein n=1 Tax=Bacillati TaxID=1783272 RepID=UPI001C6E14A4|nr:MULTISPECIES: ABC transporter ATP-binding protein [Terrabacteria group]MBW9212879.1 ABC transporter ATP-binding protein/permease [Trueperella sp. zg.1013]